MIMVGIVASSHRTSKQAGQTAGPRPDVRTRPRQRATRLAHELPRSVCRAGHLVARPPLGDVLLALVGDHVTGNEYSSRRPDRATVCKRTVKNLGGRTVESGLAVIRGLGERSVISVMT